MAKKFIPLLLVVALFGTACNREARNLKGDYSYKLSGDVVVINNNGSENHHFIHRVGQMNVLKDKSSKTGYVITMNEMNGGCYTIPAKLRGDSLVLDPHTFTTTILSSEGISIIDQEQTFTAVYEVQAFGSGRINDNTLILREAWTGYESGAPSNTISAPQITILAEKN